MQDQPPVLFPLVVVHPVGECSSQHQIEKKQGVSVQYFPICVLVHFPMSPKLPNPFVIFIEPLENT